MKKRLRKTRYLRAVKYPAPPIEAETWECLEGVVVIRTKDIHEIKANLDNKIIGRTTI